MKKRILVLGVLTVLSLLCTLPVLASEAPPAAADQAKSGGGNWYLVLPAFAMALASCVCGLSQSKAIVAACESVSRNPGAADSIRFFLILGLVLIESLALYTLLIIFAK